MTESLVDKQDEFMEIVDKRYESQCEMRKMEDRLEKLKEKAIAIQMGLEEKEEEESEEEHEEEEEDDHHDHEHSDDVILPPILSKEEI